LWSRPAAEHPRLRVLNLLQHPPGRTWRALTAEAEKAAYIDAQYLSRREEIDLQPASPVRALYEFRLARNLRTMTGLSALIRTRRYHCLVTPNGWVLEFGAAYRVATLHGLPVNTLEVHDRKDSIFAAQGVPCLLQNYEGGWQADEPHTYTPERRRRVEQTLADRLPASSQHWGEYGEVSYRWQSAPPAGTETLVERLGLDGSKPLALLCANVCCDSIVLGRTRTFRSMGDWIRRTIDFFAGRPDWQLVIRAHPGERVMQPVESVESIVRHHRPGALPPNIRLVLPNDPVNTYSLMRVARLGLVYNSTTGLEMAAAGLPVVAAGPAHYLGKGFTLDPETAEEYVRALSAVLGGKQQITPRQTVLACCYFDLYFHAWPFPFPWFHGRVAADLRVWSVRRVLSAEGRARFGRTFEYLAGHGPYVGGGKSQQARFVSKSD
jgi:hypothetical protein